MLESFLNALVGFVDTFLAASLSEAATSAIGVASYFQWFIGLIAIALGVGATAMVSRAVAKGRTAFAGAVVGQVVLLSLAFGAGAGALIALLAPRIGLMTGLEPGGEAMGHVVTYLRVVAIGVPGVTILFSGIACCRGAGDAVRPLVAMVVVNAVNVVASFLLAGVDLRRTVVGDDGVARTVTLIANPSPFELGVLGIALGTLIAWSIGAVLMLGMLVRGTHGVRLRMSRLRPHLHTVRRLLRVGLPNFFETAGMWVGNFLTVLLVGLMGDELLHGAHIVAIRIEAFSFLPGFAMATAAATLAGQYLGAGRPELARLAVLRCSAIGAGIMFALGVAFITAPGAIVRIFTEQPLHMELAPQLVFVCGLIQLPFALAIVIRGALRGAGDTTAVMALTWISTWGIRLPLAWLCCGVDLPIPIPFAPDLVIPNPAPLQRLFDVHPLVGLWVGLCAEICVRFLLFLWRFLQGGWQRVRV